MDKKTKGKLSNEYNSKTYKRVPLNIKNDDYERLKTYCNTHNLKVNTFIKLCIEKCMNEGFSPAQPEHKSYYNKAEK